MIKQVFRFSSCHSWFQKARYQSDAYSPLPAILFPKGLAYSPFPKKIGDDASVTLKVEDGTVPRFCIGAGGNFEKSGVVESNRCVSNVKKNMSRKAKLKELRFFRLKAKKKMNSSNPEVRIRYKLEKAKRKEEWLIEKLRKFELPRTAELTHDPESLTEEEKFYLKRTGEKKKNYVNVGRRGVFGGVVLNMHLHWKKHETVKVVCKPCRPWQVHEFAEELTRLSKGIVIDVKSDNTIIFYRGKNYVRPTTMSPTPTLSKNRVCTFFFFFFFSISFNLDNFVFQYLTVFLMIIFAGFGKIQVRTISGAHKSICGEAGTRARGLLQTFSFV